MVNQNPSNNEVSLLERVLINWATPIEGLFVYPCYKAGAKADPKYQEFIDQYGLFKG